jgi:hypothetical protein
MTAYKQKKIFMRVEGCDSEEAHMKAPKEQATSPFVNLSMTNMRQQPLLDFH